MAEVVGAGSGDWGSHKLPKLCAWVGGGAGEGGKCSAHIFQKVVPLIGHIEKVKMCLVFLNKI